MLINVAQLLKGPIGSVRSYEVDETVEVPDLGNTAVKGKVELLRTHRGILARGTLRTGIELDCSRCLTSYKCPLTLNIEDEFLPTIDIVTGNALEIPEDDNFFNIDEHHILDLTEATRQYIVMAVPMKPLCRKDCAGLCIECGQNLNLGPCCCQAGEHKSGTAEPPESRPKPRAKQLKN